MTRAICIKCGNEKHGCWTPCHKCCHSPFGEQELAQSLVLSDQFLTDEGLAMVFDFVAQNNELPVFKGDTYQGMYDRAEQTVRDSARALAKRGLMPPTDT